ncbi:MAG TPA: rod shape-determining protein MreC [Gemmatimonadaceae bacterium]|nr:rod shape-determining protein MreC [Gemmatimonadaceae bacterium]
MARATRLSSRIDFLLFIGCLIAAAVALVLPLQMRDPLAELLRRSVVAPLVNLQSNAERWHAAWQLSEERTARLDSAVMRGFNAVALQNENDELRKLLGLGARLHTGFVPAEAVHNAVREDVVTTLTLTAGTRAGIKVYSPVVSPEGVVGIVQTADPTISIAILFSHPDFRASAMSGDGTAFGIVYPHLQQSLGGNGEYLLELHNVPFRIALPAGTMIYTSGLGGTFPRGIPIGSVLRELKTPEGWSRTYLLQPSVNPAKVNAVMVLTSQRSGQKMDNVWQMIPRVDSATRSIVSAGDSVARRAAADSARRAAADSMRKVTPLHPAADSSALSDSAKRSAAQKDSVARADSIRAARAARREAARRDSIRRDSARRDSARRDSIRRDSIRRDTTRRDTTTHRP